MNKKISIIFLVLFSNTVISAQTKQITHQTLYWTRYYNQLIINDKWSLHNEIDNRRFINPHKQHHFITHSHLRYRLNPTVEIAAGFTYSRQSPQFPNSISDLVIPELRPFQEITVNQSYTKRFSISNRLRIDERFIHRNNGKVLLDGYDFNFRFRYRLQVSYLLSKPQNPYPTILKIADELMINAGEIIRYNVFDQNRIYVAIEKNIGKKLSVELGYMNWFQQRPTGKDFFKRDIIRFTIYHRIKIK